MRMTDEITIFWRALSVNQKRVVGAFVLIFVGFLVFGAASWFGIWRELRVEKRNAAHAREDDANAEKIGNALTKAGKKIKQLEGKRDEKGKEVGKAKREVRDANADYDRARREPVKRIPSSDELCESFKKLGYPCD